MEKFKKGDVCVIHSKTSHNNGKIVIVEKYPHKSRDDILLVALRQKKFLITENSLVLASKFDIIRNMNDRKLAKFLPNVVVKPLVSTMGI